MIQFNQQGVVGITTITENEAIQYVLNRCREKGIEYPPVMDVDYHALLDFVSDNWAWQIEPISPVNGREIRL